jgi:hypothetical protein
MEGAMRPEDWPDEFRRDYLKSRLWVADALERAWSMLPPDAVSRAAIDGYRQFALREDYPAVAAHLAVALDRLDECALRRGPTREFWLLLSDVAVMDALYERAADYRGRAAALAGGAGQAEEAAG